MAELIDNHKDDPDSFVMDLQNAGDNNKLVTPPPKPSVQMPLGVRPPLGLSLGLPKFGTPPAKGLSKM